MNILTEDKWLKLFKINDISYNTFINTYKVKSENNIVTLKETIINKNLKKKRFKSIIFLFYHK